MIEFLGGVGFGFIVAGLLSINKYGRDYEMYIILKGVAENCRRSKKMGDYYLERARLIVQRWEE